MRHLGTRLGGGLSGVIVTNQVLFLQEEIHAAAGQMLENVRKIFTLGQWFMIPHLWLMLSFAPYKMPEINVALCKSPTAVTKRARASQGFPISLHPWLIQTGRCRSFENKDQNKE